MKRNDTKKIVLCAFYAAILFIQEQALSWLPNIQLTFLLIIVFGAVIGLKWGSLVVIVHVVADNLIWGSITPYIFIPMLMGQELALLLGYLTRNKPLWKVVIAGIFASIAYCLIFIPFQIIVFKVDFILYWLADLPFEALLVASTSLTLIWLYKPIKKLIIKQWFALGNSKEQNNELPLE